MPFVFRKSARRFPQRTLFFSAWRGAEVCIFPDFSPLFGEYSSEKRDFGLFLPACSFIWSTEMPSCEKAKRKTGGAMADAPRFALRTRFPCRVHLSSQGRFPLTSCPGCGTQNPRICHWSPVRQQIRDSRAPCLTFCKMSNVSRDGSNRECRAACVFESVRAGASVWKGASKPWKLFASSGSYFYGFLADIPQIFVTLQRFVLPVLSGNLSGRRMKRESGGSPGQSRCCKLIVWLVYNLMPLPYNRIRWEG